jgi:hypothetical protein
MESEEAWLKPMRSVCCQMLQIDYWCDGRIDGVDRVRDYDAFLGFV